MMQWGLPRKLTAFSLSEPCPGHEDPLSTPFSLTLSNQRHFVFQGDDQDIKIVQPSDGWRVRNFGNAVVRKIHGQVRASPFRPPPSGSPFALSVWLRVNFEKTVLAPGHS